MARFHDKGKVTLHRLSQCIENLLRHLGHLAAIVADEVMVFGVLSEVVNGRAVAEPDMIHNAEPLEFVEKAVHRRLCDFGLILLHRRRDVFGGGVVVVVIDQRLQDRPSGRRCPTAARADLGQYFVDPGVGIHGTKSRTGESWPMRQKSRSMTHPFVHPLRIAVRSIDLYACRSGTQFTQGGPMSTEEYVPRARKWKRGAAAGTGFALLAGVFASQAGPVQVSASSHREAPLISGDPRADNTDVYAFVSPDNANTVTLISNWIPFEEPNGGPNFYPFADDTRYNIKIDNDGDALADLTYTWIFDTVVRDGDNQFLTNTGPVTTLRPVVDPDLNVYQTYDLTLTREGFPPVALLGNGDGVTSPGDPVAAPSSAGPASMPDYKTLRDQAIYDTTDGGKTYSGQADDPFFIDLRIFDLLYGANATEVGEDTLAGYNVNTIALQVPKANLALGANATANPVIGIWSTTDRRSAGVFDIGQVAPLDGGFVQVSRLGNPLINEVVVPYNLKDAFNSIRPDQDADQPAVVAKVLDPIVPKLIQAIYGVPAPAPPRNDIFEIFLQGISKANAGPTGNPAVVLPVDLNSLDLNADVADGNFRASEMLRLNMSIAPTAAPNRYGVLAGDIQGFPNGRRLTDDVLDIEIQALEGAALTGQLVTALLTIDSVDRNDRDFGSTFPYVALPHQDSVNNGTERTPRAPEIISVNPQRLLETRSDQPSGQIGYAGAQPIAGQTIELKVTGVGPALVPDDATTVFLNVTATNSQRDGYVTVWPCGSPRPFASNLNPMVGLITHNLVAAKIGAGGKVCIFTNQATDLIADLTSYHPAGSAYIPHVPERLLETRMGQPTGQIGYAGAKPGEGSTVTLKVTGVGTAKLPADTKAVLLNVTAVNSDVAGFVTVYPCGSPRPFTSNLNLVPGLVRPNLVAAKVGAGGTVCLFSSKATDLVVDLQGAVPVNSTYVPVVPERVLETRLGQPTGQINYSAGRPVIGQTTEVKVIGFGNTNIPAGTGTVFLNVTAAEPSTAGFVTVFPCGSTRPLASNLNLNGVSTPAMVSVKVGDGGRVCIFTSGSTDLVVDIQMRWSSSVIVSRVMASSAANGSSMSRSSGSWTRPRARPTRCCMPPESSCG